MWLALAIFVVLIGLTGYGLGRNTATSTTKPANRQHSDATANQAEASPSGQASTLSTTQGDAAESQLIEQVNALLPQTQCAQCQHPGCRPYAEAIIRNDEPINRCPPGGDATIRDIANLLGREAVALDTEYGDVKPERVALIVEAECIGCKLCIQACPVDAIVGANKLMHAVLEDRCTGCELCIPPCPVDCIDMVPARQRLSEWPPEPVV